jgi:hypothetical protein
MNMENVMRAKMMVAILVTVACFTACGNKADEAANTQSELQVEEQTEAKSEKIETSEATGEDVMPRELTESELTAYSEYLSGRDSYGFLLSSYEDVKDVDLGQVFYSGAGLSEQPNEEEKEAYLEEMNQEELYTDLFYVSAEKADDLLREKTGYSLEEFQEDGNDMQMVYLEAYDAYFAEVGDTNYIEITCTSGTENSDGTITLDCVSGMEGGDESNVTLRCTVTLEQASRQFISNEITGGIYLLMEQ